jgi:uncharacterized protein (TIGR04255 family)
LGVYTQLGRFIVVVGLPDVIEVSLLAQNPLRLVAIQLKRPASPIDPDLLASLKRVELEMYAELKSTFPRIEPCVLHQITLGSIKGPAEPSTINPVLFPPDVTLLDEYGNVKLTLGPGLILIQFVNQYPGWIRVINTVDSIIEKYLRLVSSPTSLECVLTYYSQVQLPFGSNIHEFFTLSCNYGEQQQNILEALEPFSIQFQRTHNACRGRFHIYNSQSEREQPNLNFRFDVSSNPIEGQQVHDWLEMAHSFQKETFFKIATPKFVELMGGWVQDA